MSLPQASFAAARTTSQHALPGSITARQMICSACSSSHSTATFSHSSRSPRLIGQNPVPRRAQHRLAVIGVLRVDAFALLRGDGAQHARAAVERAEVGADGRIVADLLGEDILRQLNGGLRVGHALFFAHIRLRQPRAGRRRAAGQKSRPPAAERPFPWRSSRGCGASAYTGGRRPPTRRASRRRRASFPAHPSSCPAP